MVQYLMHRMLLSFLLCTTALSCVSSNTQELAQLRAELKAERESLIEVRTELHTERELLAKTRAELSEAVRALAPLAEMAKLAFDNSLPGLPEFSPQPSETEEPTPSRHTAASDEANDELRKLLASETKSISPTEYKATRRFLDTLLENPMAVARGARIVPSQKNGKANGFKLYAIRPTSIYAGLGLRNGDTIHNINGFELSSPDKALDVYTRIRNAKVLNFALTRRGKPVVLRIHIVEDL